MSEPKYYNIWDVHSKGWASGYRTTNERQVFQDPKNPWLLTKQEVEEWVANDWTGHLNERYYQIREISPHWQDQLKRQQYADKYL